MAANIEKQNLRYRKVSDRYFNKIRFDGFKSNEVNFIKLTLVLRLVEKDLNSFWKYVPRLSNSAVNWNALNEKELDYFHWINNKSNGLLKRLSKLEDKGVDGDRVFIIFNNLNNKSVCF